MSHEPATPTRHSRKGLVIPFAIAGGVLALWTGWWFYLANQVENRLNARLERLQQAGWTIKYDHRAVSGWPIHTRVNFENLEVVAPSGQGFRTPSLAAEANSYNPLRWLVGTRDGATLLRGEKGETRMNTPAIRMSVTGLRQPWPNIAAEVVSPGFTDAQGAAPFAFASAELVQLYMRPHRLSPTGSQDSADVMFRLVDGVGREGGPVRAFSQDGELTLQLEAVVREASALRQPADRRGLLSAWTAKGGHFTDVRGEMQAGATHALLTSPEMKLDSGGRPLGEMTFKARNPLAAINGLAGTGQPAKADTAPDDQAEQMEITVRFEDGRIHIGRFPLFSAPSLF